MSKFNVGDEFIVEIAEVFKGAESGNDRYRIKGFDSVVFDERGLKKLKQCEKVECSPIFSPELHVYDHVRFNGKYAITDSAYGEWVLEAVDVDWAFKYAYNQRIGDVDFVGEVMSVNKKNKIASVYIRILNKCVGVRFEHCEKL